VRDPELDPGERELGERELGERELGERELGERELGERELGERELGEGELGGKEATQPIRETEAREKAYRSSEDEVDWREQALKLQAEMAGYRRRQQLLAHAEAKAEEIALLKDVLSIADNLDRALAAARIQPTENGQAADALTQGVELTRVGLDRILAKYGVEQMEAQGAMFDPAYHEAVYTVPALAQGLESGTVVEVLEAGYHRQGTVFRPAKVVVAQ
jgi:molecular chaperone GrpE